MLRNLAAAGAIVLGTAQTGDTGTVRAQAAGLCGPACRNMASALPSAQDVMAAKLARIAEQATLPQTGEAGLSDEDRVALLLLFSLQRGETGRKP